MAIQTNLTYDQALALPNPKHIFINGSQVVVYTGVDIPSSARSILPYDFRQRFTENEMGAILLTAYNGDANIRKLLLKLQTTESVDLDDAVVIAGVDYLVSQAIITAERKTEILS